MTDLSKPDAPRAVDPRFEAFSFPAYRNFWVARFLSAFAINMIAVAVGWQIYDLTRDPLDLGLIGLSQFAPAVILVLITGAAADRFGRRNIMLLSETSFFIVALGLFLLTWHGLTSPIPVFALLVLMGIARAFYGPATSSLVVNLVPERVFPNAVTWSTSSWQVASIVGPVAGGLLYGAGPLVPYGVALGFLGIAIAFLTQIPSDERVAQTEEEDKKSQIFAGFKFIFGQPVVLGAISLDLFAVLLGGAVALLPVFARDVLHLGPWGLGLLRAAPGIGAVVMAAYLASVPIKDHAGLFMFIGVALFGAFTLTFGLSTVAWLSIFSMVMLGAADMISVQVRETLIQLWTPDDVRGRVNAVNGLFVGASNELGEMRAGAMAAVIGAVPAVVVGGAGTIIVAGLWAYIFPALRKIRYLDRRGEV
jgi:MFS family permease